MSKWLIIGALLCVGATAVPLQSAQSAPPTDRCSSDATRFCLRNWQAAGYPSANQCYADLYSRFCAPSNPGPPDPVCFENPDGSIVCFTT